MSFILALNAGSSNIKAARFEAASLTCAERIQFTTHADALQWLKSQEASSISAVAHRVVHGGAVFHEHTAITPETLSQIKELARLAPLHQPPAIRLIEEAQAILPKARHIACFDTVFHAGLPLLEQRFALPESYAEQGFRRYGFHGLSYEHVASQLPSLLGGAAEGRVIAAHLGGGASLCALYQRRSVATTMGFSTLDGLMMGTRCGSLDAGLVLHWLEHEGATIAELNRLLYKESGLKGVSGLSANMRELEAAAPASPAAEFALAMFAHVAAKQIAGLVVALGGLDVLVFTGGIGEHGTAMRRRIADKLAWLGLTLDETANAVHAPIISTSASKVAACIIEADEESVMAQAC